MLIAHVIGWYDRHNLPQSKNITDSKSSENYKTISYY